MRTLAIGDIHGCLTALETLLDFAQVQSDDLIITLGDYVDRGPDSRGVIDLLISLGRQEQLVAIRGNHDFMMLEARRKNSARDTWLALGGDATLKSYSKKASLKDVPDEHWQFLEHTCVNYYETPTHIFVHAGLWPELPLGEQPEFVLFYERFHNPAPHMSGKIVICGHTNQKSGLPRDEGHAICIDTRVYKGGWLTCLDAQSGQFWQANQKGQTRQMRLDEL
jgi:serine/threonine protein phosphatase 1